MKRRHQRKQAKQPARPKFHAKREKPNNKYIEWLTCDDYGHKNEPHIGQ